MRASPRSGRALTPDTASEVNLLNGALGGFGQRVDLRWRRAGIWRTSHLTAWLFDPVDGTFTIDLGRLRRGRSTYQGVAQTDCPCRLVGIGVLPSAKRVPSSGQIHLGLNALTYRSGKGVPHNARAELTPADWRSSMTGVRVIATARGSASTFR